MIGAVGLEVVVLEAVVLGAVANAADDRFGVGVERPNVADQGDQDCGAELHNREGSLLEAADLGCYASSSRYHVVDRDEVEHQDVPHAPKYDCDGGQPLNFCGSLCGVHPFCWHSRACDPAYRACAYLFCLCRHTD